MAKSKGKGSVKAATSSKSAELAVLANAAVPGMDSRLMADLQAFDHLMSLIPAKFYFPMHDDDEVNHKFMHNKKRKRGEDEQVQKKQLIKQAKRARLDPDSEAMALEATARGPTEADNRADPRVQVATNGTDPRIHSAPASVAELRERLAARISHLRTARGLDSDDRPKSRAEIIERREKRRKDSDDRKQSVKDKKAKGSGGPTAKVGLLDSIAAVAKTPTPSSNGKSADSLVDSVSFGNVDFGATALDLQRRPQKLDAKTALSKLEAKNRKLATIAEKDADKFEVIKEKEAWSKIQKLAGGEKVKDDVKLLKKTIKKLEKKKERSKKDWDARLYTQHKGKSDKQQKRNDNLAQRKDDKINKFSKDKKKPSKSKKSSKSK